MAFSKFRLDDFEDKGEGKGAYLPNFSGYLKRPQELLILFTNVFISNKYT